MNGPQSDAALYWKSYAQSHAGKRDSALASLAELNRRFPQSRWAKDAKALDIEVRQSSGQLVQAEGESDCELKMLAMQGAMNGDPEKAMPILEKFIGGFGSPPSQKKDLFVLSANDSPKTRENHGRLSRRISHPVTPRPT